MPHCPFFDRLRRETRLATLSRCEFRLDKNHPRQPCTVTVFDVFFNNKYPALPVSLERPAARLPCLGIIQEPDHRLPWHSLRQFRRGQLRGAVTAPQERGRVAVIHSIDLFPCRRDAQVDCPCLLAAAGSGPRCALPDYADELQFDCPFPSEA